MERIEILIMLAKGEDELSPDEVKNRIKEKIGPQTTKNQ